MRLCTLHISLCGLHCLLTTFNEAFQHFLCEGLELLGPVQALCGMDIQRIKFLYCFMAGMMLFLIMFEPPSGWLAWLCHDWCMYQTQAALALCELFI